MKRYRFFVSCLVCLFLASSPSGAKGEYGVSSSQSGQDSAYRTLSLNCPGGDSEVVRRRPERNFSSEDYWSNLNQYLHSDPYILKYRIQWFSGGWSSWYYPGYWDIDWKTNRNGTVRRVWSYFDDHNHELVYCPQIEVEQPHKIEGQKTNYCSDSDGGARGKHTVKGCVSWRSVGGDSGKKCDFCIGDSVGEFYCVAKYNQVNFTTIECETGCAGGECY